MPFSNTVRKVVAWRSSRDRGASSVEYGLLIGFIAFVIFFAVMSFGNVVRNLYQSACDSFPGGSCP